MERPFYSKGINCSRNATVCLCVLNKNKAVVLLSFMHVTGIVKIKTTRNQRLLHITIKPKAELLRCIKYWEDTVQNAKYYVCHYIMYKEHISQMKSNKIVKNLGKHLCMPSREIWSTSGMLMRHVQSHRNDAWEKYLNYDSSSSTKDVPL